MHLILVEAIGCFEGCVRDFQLLVQKHLFSQSLTHARTHTHLIHSTSHQHHIYLHTENFSRTNFTRNLRIEDVCALGFLHRSVNVWLFDKHHIYDCFESSEECLLLLLLMFCVQYTHVKSNKDLDRAPRYVCFYMSVLNSNHSRESVCVRHTFASSMYKHTIFFVVSVFFASFGDFPSMRNPVPSQNNTNTDCVPIFMLSLRFPSRVQNIYTPL